MNPYTASLSSLIHAHPTIAALIAYFAFASIVDTMPIPTATSGVAYTWAYKALNMFAANIFSQFGNKLPATVAASAPTSNPAAMGNSTIPPASTPADKK